MSLRATTNERTVFVIIDQLGVSCNIQLFYQLVKVHTLDKVKSKSNKIIIIIAINAIFARIFKKSRFIGVVQFFVASDQPALDRDNSLSE